ncbi:MAG: complex I NDUFA9 subunit family protein [Rhodospirillales bacterium]|nr:complex I NDUFA9 subunit family protein [Rhodospirillales bacterium]
MAQQLVTVFGGSGFLGRYVVRRLAATGASVRVAVRDAVAAEYLKTAGEVGQVVPISASTRSDEAVQAAIEGADCVINLTGILAEWGKQSFETIHVEGAGRIAKTAKAAGVSKLIHVSAQSADPDSPSVYAKTKAAGEEAVLAAYPEATIFRPHVIFGAEDQFFNLFAGIMRLTVALPVFGCPVIPKVSFFKDDKVIDIDLYGDGGTKFQPVYVDDVAKAIMVAVEDHSTDGKRYELAGPEVYSFKQLMEMLLENTGRKRLLAPIPFGIAKFGAWFIEKFPNPLLTRDQLTQLQSDHIMDPNAEGLAQLGIEPTPAEIILPTYLQRFRPQRSQSPRLA